MNSGLYQKPMKLFKNGLGGPATIRLKLCILDVLEFVDKGADAQREESTVQASAD
jgi:hypothetical protein